MLVGGGEAHVEYVFGAREQIHLCWVYVLWVFDVYSARGCTCTYMYIKKREEAWIETIPFSLPDALNEIASPAKLIKQFYYDSKLSTTRANQHEKNTPNQHTHSNPHPYNRQRNKSRHPSPSTLMFEYVKFDG